MEFLIATVIWLLALAVASWLTAKVVEKRQLRRINQTFRKNMRPYKG